MGVPTARTDLNATASSNSPAGGDTIGASTGPDDYLRAHASLIRANYDDIQLKAPLASPTFTGHITTEGVTATGATGTGNIVFSAAPTFTGKVTAPLVVGATPTTTSGAGGTMTMDFTANNIIILNLTSTGTITLNTGSFPGTGWYTLLIISSNEASASWGGTAYSASRWLGATSAPAINTAEGGRTIVEIFYDATAQYAYQRMGRVGAT